MLLPFSNLSKDWERHGFALRKIAGVFLREIVDPWKLAAKVGLTVVDGNQALTWLNENDRRQLFGQDRYGWSGGVFPQELPDGTRICIVNPTHSPKRNKITLMEEIAHAHLKHNPTSLVLMGEGLRVRDYSKFQEQEAYGVGAATLIPWILLFPALNAGRAIPELAKDFEVTTELIEYRIKVTGGYRIYQARQRKRAGVLLSSR